MQTKTKGAPFIVASKRNWEQIVFALIRKNVFFLLRSNASKTLQIGSKMKEKLSTRNKTRNERNRIKAKERKEKKKLHAKRKKIGFLF